MMRLVKVFAVAALLGIGLAATPDVAQARWGHHWHGGGWGPGFALGFGLGAAPYYYGGPYAYDYGPDCGWVRVRTYYGWRRVWRCW